MLENRNFYGLDDEAQARCLTGLAEAAVQNWAGGFEVLDLLKYRENAVFAVRNAGGEKMALRIHRYGYHSDAELRSELQWMEALAEAGFAVPWVQLTSDGALFATAEHPEIPEPRQVDMLSWVEGRPFGEVETGLDADAVSVFRDMGRLAGDLHNHGDVWVPPEGFTRPAWDLEGLVGDDPLWGRFWKLAALKSEEVALLDSAREAARHDLLNLDKRPETYGLIHADFVPENLIVTDAGLNLIDFDDAGFGWYMFELATALVFHCGEDQFEDMKTALIEGYRSVRPLAEEEERRLPLFLFLRATTYLGWVHTRSETQTARELTPMLIDNACTLASAYLDR